MNTYECDPSCNCSIEVVCSAVLLLSNTTSIESATIRWYAATNTTALLISGQQNEMVTVKRSNGHIISSLQLPVINKKEQFTDYWCIVDDLTHNSISKQSNALTVSQLSGVNCSINTGIKLQYQWNKTCAVWIPSDDSNSEDDSTETNGIDIVVISSVGTFVSIVIFLTVIIVYCILHFKAKGKQVIVLL